MLENAARLCEAKFGSCSSREDGSDHRSRLRAYGRDQRGVRWTRSGNSSRSARSIGRLMLDREIVHIRDCRPTQRYQLIARFGGRRAPSLGVPLLKEGELIGAIGILPRRRCGRSPTSRSSWSNFRRPGRDRHREHAAVRGAAARTASSRIAGAADRDVRGAARSSVQLARRAGARVQTHAGERDAHLRGQVRRSMCCTRATRFARSRCTMCRRLLARSQARAVLPSAGQRRLGASRRPSSASTIADVTSRAGISPSVSRTCRSVDLAGAARCSSCRCSRRTSWSARSASTARRCARSPTSRSSWSRTSPTRP